MTINQLNKLTGKLVAKGAGRRGVCVSKDTFTHPLESDGATILDVVKGDLEVFPIADDDGGTKVTAKGLEVVGMALVLQGGESGDALRNSQWIDCADRLPGHLHSVLGYVTGGGLVVLDEKMIDCVSYDPERKAWLQSVGTEDAVVTVTHWMPLPYPPFKRSIRRW